MLERYIAFINGYLSGLKSQKLLLAVSGGVDSMVMLDLCVRADLNIAVAHINHDLRGESSDADALLVEKICNECAIPFHLYTLTDQEKNSSNFQEHARNIRYQWMNGLCQKHGYSLILTAHHQNDSIETFLLNLMRGAGLNGLTGISTLHKNVFRPLIQFSKNEIHQYAINNQIEFREDDSNSENKYRRNLIRNEWLPFLNNSGLPIEKMIHQTIMNLKSDKVLLQNLVDEKIQSFSSTNHKGYKVFDISEYMTENQLLITRLLYKHLSSFGFSYDNTLKSIKAVSGAVFRTSTHELLKNRNQLILRELESFNSTYAIIKNDGKHWLGNQRINISAKEIEGGFLINNLTLPFTIRSWKSGDRMKPNGMNGASKKVKDILIDMKIDLWTKQSTLIVEKDDEIIAILPYRVAQGHGDSNEKTKIYIQLEA